MYPTNYHKPDTLEAALALLSSSEEAKVLAGGHTLLPTMKNHLAAPTDVVDIRGIASLSGISEEGGRRVVSVDQEVRVGERLAVGPASAEVTLP